MLRGVLTVTDSDFKKKMNFRDIDPYVRYINYLSFKPGMSTGQRIIFDHQFLFIYRGKGFIDIEGIRYPASQNDLFFYGPRTVHNIIADKYDPFTVTGIHFDHTCDNTDKWVFITPPDNPEINSHPEYKEVVFKDFDGFPPHMNLSGAPEIKNILLKMVDEYNRRQRFFETNLKGLFLTFLSIISRLIINKREGIEGSEQLTTEIIKYLQENYMEDLSNKKLAAQFYFHPNYLNHIIVTNTGKSLHQYLMDIRIKKAISMLLNTQISISEVALAVGYSDTHYFSRIFKRKVGFTPNQVRQHIKMDD